MAAARAATSADAFGVRLTPLFRADLPDSPGHSYPLPPRNGCPTGRGALGSRLAQHSAQLLFFVPSAFKLQKAYWTCLLSTIPRAAGFAASNIGSTNGPDDVEGPRSSDDVMPSLKL